MPSEWKTTSADFVFKSPDTEIHDNVPFSSEINNKTCNLEQLQTALKFVESKVFDPDQYHQYIMDANILKLLHLVLSANRDDEYARGIMRNIPNLNGYKVRPEGFKYPEVYSELCEKYF